MEISVPHFVFCVCMNAGQLVFLLDQTTLGFQCKTFIKDDLCSVHQGEKYWPDISVIPFVHCSYWETRLAVSVCSLCESGKTILLRGLMERYRYLLFLHITADRYLGLGIVSKCLYWYQSDTFLTYLTLRNITKLFSFNKRGWNSQM